MCLGLCQRKLANPIRVFLLIVYEITCFRILVLFSFLWVHLQKELTKCLRIPLLHALNSRLFSISIHACNKVVFLQQKSNLSMRTCVQTFFSLFGGWWMYVHEIGLYLKVCKITIFMKTTSSYWTNQIHSMFSSRTTFRRCLLKINNLIPNLNFVICSGVMTAKQDGYCRWLAVTNLSPWVTCTPSTSILW